MTRRNLTLRAYQDRAKATDQRPVDDEAHEGSDDAFVIPLLGIGGELGTLQAEYKKYLRDGDEYRPFRDHIREELGDILRYVANLATKFALDLTDIADRNRAGRGRRVTTAPGSGRPSGRCSCGWRNSGNDTPAVTSERLLVVVREAAAYSLAPSPAVRGHQQILSRPADLGIPCRYGYPASAT